MGKRSLQEICLLNDEGGYGVIWKVRDNHSGQIFALKKMNCMGEHRKRTAQAELRLYR